MKTFTVLPSDNSVIIDGEARLVDCSAQLDQTIHAIQWDEENLRGYIEFVDEDPNDGFRKPNESIDSIEQYQFLIDAWVAAAPPELEHYDGANSTR